MLNGIAPQQIVETTSLLKEYPISNLYDENSSANVGIVLSLEDKDKTNLQDIQNLKIKGNQGNMIPNKRFGESKNRYYKKPFIEKTRSAWFT
jgi:multidrug efflux pump subunit AcrB